MEVERTRPEAGLPSLAGKEGRGITRAHHSWRNQHLDVARATSVAVPYLAVAELLSWTARARSSTYHRNREWMMHTLYYDSYKVYCELTQKFRLDLANIKLGLSDWEPIDRARKWGYVEGQVIGGRSPVCVCIQLLSHTPCPQADQHTGRNLLYSTDGYSGSR